MLYNRRPKLIHVLSKKQNTRIRTGPNREDNFTFNV